MGIEEHLVWSAERALYSTFDYGAANAHAQALLDLTGSEPGDEGRDDLRLVAHRVRAVVLRDRNDMSAETHYSALLRIAAHRSDQELAAETFLSLHTARSNRRDLLAADRALGCAHQLIRAHGMNTLMPSFLRSLAGQLEWRGRFEEAAIVTKKAVWVERDTEWTAPTLTGLARRTARAASATRGRDRVKRLDRALTMFHQSGKQLGEDGNRVFSTSLHASLGLAAHGMGDLGLANQCLRLASRNLVQMDIRNRWTEDLEFLLGSTPEYLETRPNSLLVGISRSFWGQEFGDRYRELFAGLETLLRSVSRIYGRQAPVGGSALYRAARDLLKEQGLNIETALAQHEFRRYARLRNEIAHSPKRVASYRDDLVKLHSSLRMLIDLLPDEVLDDAQAIVSKN